MDDKKKDPLDQIPHADDLKQQAEADPMDYDRWLNQTLGFIGAFISKNQGALLTGGMLYFTYPSLRDGGRGLKMWKRHAGKVANLVQQRGYTTAITQTDPPTLTIRRKLNPPNPIPAEYPPNS